MAEIVVSGKQVWRDRIIGRRMKIVGHTREHGLRPRVWLHPLTAGYRAVTMLEDAFLVRFELEPEQTLRRIALTLAADTTETECGACPCITEREQCGAFSQKDLDNNAEGTFLRLPECIAAEVKP